MWASYCWLCCTWQKTMSPTQISQAFFWNEWISSFAVALTRRGVRPDRGVQLVDLERPVPPWWVWREYEWEGRWEWHSDSQAWRRNNYDVDDDSWDWEGVCFLVAEGSPGIWAADWDKPILILHDFGGLRPMQEGDRLAPGQRIWGGSFNSPRQNAIPHRLC